VLSSDTNVDRIIVLLTDDQTADEGFDSFSENKIFEYVRKLNDEQNNTVTIIAYAICESSGKFHSIFCLENNVV